jgi:hypothetical protein
MATPKPEEAAKLAILRQQLMEKVAQNQQYTQQSDRQYTPVLQPNPNWMPKKAGGGQIDQDTMRLALMKPAQAHGGITHAHHLEIEERPL